MGRIGGDYKCIVMLHVQSHRHERCEVVYDTHSAIIFWGVIAMTYLAYYINTCKKVL